MIKHQQLILMAMQYFDIILIITDMRKQNSQLSQLQYLLVHFKNCMHQGTFSLNMARREGPGITILDSGSIIIGSFKQDQLNGLSLIYITLDTYFIGEISKGCLNGPFVIRSPGITVYSNANINKIDGQILVINYKSKYAQLWSVEADGSCQIYKQLSLEEYLYKDEMLLAKISHKMNKSEEQGFMRARSLITESQVLHNLAPYIEKLPDIGGFLNSSSKNVSISSDDFILKTFTNNKIVYLNDSRRDQESFLGVAINSNEEIVGYGIFLQLSEKNRKNSRENNPGRNRSYEQDYLLNGLGYLYITEENAIHDESDVIYEGQFSNHRLEGQGSKELLRANKAVYGDFKHGQIKNMNVIAISQQGNRSDQVKKLLQKKKKSIHVHSLQFMNNYANQRPILILKNLLRVIMKNETNLQQSRQ